MKTKEQLEKKYLGRRVKNLHGQRGVVTDMRGVVYACPLGVNYDDGGDGFHAPHQLTLLKPKKPKRVAREWWINESRIKTGEYMPIYQFVWSTWFEDPDGSFIRTTRPENTTGWICVREILED